MRIYYTTFVKIRLVDFAREGAILTSVRVGQQVDFFRNRELNKTRSVILKSSLCSDSGSPTHIQGVPKQVRHDVIDKLIIQ